MTMQPSCPSLLTLTHARLLAGSLRSERLTLLFGGAVAGPTPLLQAGLAPLLGRRTADLQASLGLQLAGVAQRPSARRSAAGRAADRAEHPGLEAEIVVVVDGWSTTPVAQVLDRLRRALPRDVARSLAGMTSLSTAMAETRRRVAARVLFVFDRFDDCLDGFARGQTGSRAFAQDFTAVANETGLPTHFLLAVRDTSEALLQRFAGGVDGYGQHCMHLPAEAEVRVQATPHKAPGAAGGPEAASAAERREAARTTERGEAAGAAEQREAARKAERPAAQRHRLRDRSPDRAMPELDALLARVAATAAANATVNDVQGTSAPASVGAPAPAAARVSTRLTPPVAADAGWPGRTAPAPAHPPAVAGAVAATTTDAVAVGTRTDAIAEVLSTDNTSDISADIDRAPSLADAPPLLGRASRHWPVPLAAVCTAAAVAMVIQALWPFAERAPVDTAALAEPRPADAPSGDNAARDASAGTTSALPAPPASPPAAPTTVSTVPTVRTAPAPAPQPAAPHAAPSFDNELQALLAAIAGAAGTSDPLAFAPGAPRLAVARYDALQARQSRPGATALNIVVPLAMEPVVFVTARDSPIDFIHQIAGQPIDAGPTGNARSISAARLHTSLFGKPAPERSDTTASEAAALQRLARGGSTGIVLVGARALDDFAAAHPASVRRLKALRLDRSQPSSRAVLRDYLPLTLPNAAHPGWLDAPLPTLGVMSFVVTPASTAPFDQAQVEDFALALCRALPRLRRNGNPLWRQVAPLDQVPALWPYSAIAARTFADCAAQPSQLSPQPKEGARS